MLKNINLEGPLLKHYIRLKHSRRSVCGYRELEFISAQIDAALYDAFAEFNYIMGERLDVL